jgi:N-acetylmuramoyl-L-alanine amidase
MGLKVVLTRNGDAFIPLEERTAIANDNNADLFISIHVNGAADSSLAGVETYFLNLATDERSIRLAAAENATSTKSISDLQAILNDLMLNTKINESNRLAFQIQRHLVAEVKKIHAGVRSLGVKQAPFYVLLGAQMPAALVEVGFGTNSAECKRLSSPKYLDKVAEGMSQGLAEYIKATKTAQGQPKAAGGRRRGSVAASE